MLLLLLVIIFLLLLLSLFLLSLCSNYHSCADVKITGTTPLDQFTVSLPHPPF